MIYSNLLATSHFHWIFTVYCNYLNWAAEIRTVFM
uniref:Uncharacterized protein n=1 Tax=Anguilla anguilla TaxID=7936 RepID=A0A0E9QQ88_ANGAN